MWRMINDDRKPLAERLGRCIAARRTALGMSQAALAERLGLVSAETVSRYERGEREPRLSTLAKLARVLSTTPLMLLVEARFGQEDSQPENVASGAGAEEGNARDLPAVVSEGTSLLHAISAAEPAAARFAIDALRGIAAGLEPESEESPRR